MKKIILALMCVMTVICFAGCGLLGGDDGEETTVRFVTNIPEFEDIESRLEKQGYSVMYTDTAGSFKGKGLIAEKGDEDFLEIYKPENADDCTALLEQLQTKRRSAYKSVSISNDENYGNVVFIGSEKALAYADVQYEHIVVKVTE